jgi:hypothetical protein
MTVPTADASPIDVARFGEYRIERRPAPPDRAR